MSKIMSLSLVAVCVSLSSVAKDHEPRHVGTWRWAVDDILEKQRRAEESKPLQSLVRPPEANLALRR